MALSGKSEHGCGDLGVLEDQDDLWWNWWKKVLKENFRSTICDLKLKRTSKSVSEKLKQRNK